MKYAHKSTATAGAPGVAQETASHKEKNIPFLVVAVVAVTTFSCLSLAAWFGMPIVLLLVAVALPWIVGLRGLLPISVSIAIVTLMAMWLPIPIFAIAGETPLPLRPLIFGALSTVGAAGSIFAYRRGPISLRELTMGFLTALSAGSGAILWLATLVGIHLGDQGPSLAWVMQGDAANNFLFTRDVLARGGIALGGEANPAPMTSILLASIAISGRTSVLPEDLTLHDLTAFATLWSFAIAALSLLAGLLAYLLMRQATAPRWLILVGSAVASFLPLTWYVSGYPIDYGFVNAPLVLIALLASVIVSFAFRAFPLISMTIQTLTATIVLATWSPLVLIPAALWLVSAISEPKKIRHFRNWQWWVHLIGIVQLLAFFAVLALPALRSQGSALSGSGAAFPFDWVPSVALALVVAGLAMVAFRIPFSYEGWIVWAVIAGSSAGLLVLLGLNWRTGLGWTYYPLKLLWIGTVLTLLVGFALASRAVSRMFLETRDKVAGAGGIIVAAMLFTFSAPAQAPGYVAEPPLLKIGADRFFGAEGGNDVALAIASFAEPDRSAIFWKTGLPAEGPLNYWLLKLSIGTFQDRDQEDNFVHLASYGLYDLNDISVMCDLIGSLRDEPVDIYTADPSAESLLRESCPPSDRELRVLPAGSLPSPHP